VKHLFLLLFLTLLPPALQAQTPLPDAAIAAFYDRLPVVQTPRYQLERGLQRQLIRSDFSTADLAGLRLNGRQLVRIDLVYTAFHRDPKFNQRQLNLDRLRNLADRLPNLLTNEALTWNLVEQAGCRTPETCQDYFHGFVLYFEPYYTAIDNSVEAARLSAALSLRTARLATARKARSRRGVPIPCGYPLSQYKLKDLTRRVKRSYACPSKQPQTVTFRATVSRRGQLESVRITDPLAACPEALTQSLRESLSFATGFRVGKEQFGFEVTGRVQLPLRRHGLTLTGYLLPDSIVRKYRIKLNAKDCSARRLRPGEPADSADLPNPDADIVTKVLARHADWDKKVIVADVTGSMSPYTLDLLTWLQLSLHQQRRTFVFFNDGDDAPDAKKRIGHTGGLYAIRTARFDSLQLRLLDAMRHGGGGDAPENDGEAVREALRLAPDAREIILLADNHTFPRDFRLLLDLSVPLRIILCGASYYVNPRYLALGRRPGITLHTLGGDLPNLHDLPTGTTINILKVQYLVTDTGLKPVKLL